MKANHASESFFDQLYDIYSEIRPFASSEEAFQMAKLSFYRMADLGLIVEVKS